MFFGKKSPFDRVNCSSSWICDPRLPPACLATSSTSLSPPPPLPFFSSITDHGLVFSLRLLQSVPPLSFLDLFLIGFYHSVGIVDFSEHVSFNFIAPPQLDSPSLINPHPQARWVFMTESVSELLGEHPHYCPRPSVYSTQDTNLTSSSVPLPLTSYIPMNIATSKVSTSQFHSRTIRNLLTPTSQHDHFSGQGRRTRIPPSQAQGPLQRLHLMRHREIPTSSGPYRR